MKQFKIYSINEWKDSVNYHISKYFFALKKEIETWFETSDILHDLEYDEFKFDSSLVAQIYPAYLYFHEESIQYKLELIIDITEIEEDNITVININFYGYSQDKDNELLGTIERPTIESNLFTEEYIIELITNFKTEFVDDKLEISDI